MGTQISVRIATDEPGPYAEIGKIISASYDPRTWMIHQRNKVRVRWDPEEDEESAGLDMLRAGLATLDPVWLQFAPAWAKSTQFAAVVTAWRIDYAAVSGTTEVELSFVREA